MVAHHANDQSYDSREPAICVTTEAVGRRQSAAVGGDRQLFESWVVVSSRKL